mmetsp:Transcript_36984/g.97937  ORF Transcript_36984/g.97937 Transcript_36984/m.97937 type:complete len:95 (-) Transcript_36984:504-788(-)
MWLAHATDGRGHHDGDGQYDVHVPIGDFGDNFFAGGEAKMEMIGTDSDIVHELPSIKPQSHVTFHLRSVRGPVPMGAIGRVCMMWHLRVRPSVM